MSLLHLHAAIRALFPAGATPYEDEAPNTATAPWVVAGFSYPDQIISEGVARLAQTGVLTVTVSALTAAQAVFLAAKVDDSLSGARVTVTGFTVGALQPDGATGPYPAGLTATDTDLRYQVIRLRYAFTYSTAM
ncbi:MAG: hypothetical protein QM628_00275 [Propionicimonas sp.]